MQRFNRYKAQIVEKGHFQVLLSDKYSLSLTSREHLGIHCIFVQMAPNVEVK